MSCEHDWKESSRAVNDDSYSCDRCGAVGHFARVIKGYRSRLAAAEAKLAEAERERVESLAALGGLPEFSLLEQCQKRQAQLNDTRAHVNALQDGAMGTTAYLGQLEKRLADAEAKLAVAVETMQELLNGTRDPGARGMGETLSVEYEIPPSTNKRVRRLLTEALARIRSMT